MTRAIMAIQLTGLYSQALIKWNGMPVATCMWGGLKTHFTIAYIVREQSGTGTTGNTWYHGAANLTANDNMLNNIESTLNSELANLHTANNAHHQTALVGIAELRTAITATQQQELALLAMQPPTAPPVYQRYTRGGGHGSYRSHGGRGQYGTPPPTTALTIPPTGGIPPAPTTGRNNRGEQQPNPNKWYNNHNYCFSCGYDIPIWYTSATCDKPQVQPPNRMQAAECSAIRGTGAHLLQARLVPHHHARQSHAGTS